ALPLRVFRGKDVALKSLVPFDLAGTGFLEPFGCALVCFHFRHVFFSRAPQSPSLRSGCFALALCSRCPALAPRFTRSFSRAPQSPSLRSGCFALALCSRCPALAPRFTRSFSRAPQSLRFAQGASPSRFARAVRRSLRASPTYKLVNSN